MYIDQALVSKFQCGTSIEYKIGEWDWMVTKKALA